MTTAGAPDLRTVWLAALGWGGGLAGVTLPAALAWGVAASVAAAATAVAVRVPRHRATAAAGLLVLVAVTGVVQLRAGAYEHGALAGLAHEQAFVTATVRVISDPLVRDGRFDRYVLLRGRTESVGGRGRATSTRVPVLIIGDAAWADVPLGALVEAQGRARPPENREIAAVLTVSRPPRTLAEPARVLDGAAVVRGGIRAAVRPAPLPQRTLVPALVVGDDQGMPPDLVEAFRVTGLTHLLAVSGTNLTLVVGFVLVLARWGGVRSRGLVAVGVLGVAGFVLLARTEPSVVRAATMGTVALLGLGAGGRGRGVRALGVAVLVLLLVDPWLAVSAGFALSVLATGGILFLAPPWRDALARWLPRWAAEAVAVPLAAQLAVTPVVAALSDQVSLVAVAANLLAAPAVAPATVLGLLGGLVVLVWPAAGTLLGQLAAASAWWITTVADHGAALPLPAIGWPAGPGSLALLTVLCLGLAAALPAVLRRRRWAALVATLAVAVTAVPAPAGPPEWLPGAGKHWPPRDWLMVACDVGQGDALVLAAGERRAVVVDAGPDPTALARCLDDLDVASVPLLVLTHFHGDHVAGVSALGHDPPVERVLVSPLAQPVAGAALVSRWAADADVPVRAVEYGEAGRTGRLRWQVLGPPPGLDTGLDTRLDTGPVTGAGETTSGEENDASVVLLVATRGVRLLLTGDIEPTGQADLLRAVPGLHVDVLKVPHHGSRHQDPELLEALGARLAVVSAGVDNDYGHPAPSTLELLRAAGAVVRRTDRAGDVAVAGRGSALRVVSR